MATANVQGDVKLLGLLLAALGSKVNKAEVASKKAVPAGEFAVEGSILFKAEGRKGENTTSRQAKGLKWKEIFSAVLACCGVTRDAARRIMACMVEWNKAIERAEESKGRKFPCPKDASPEQAKWIQQFVRPIEFTRTNGEVVEVHYLEVATVGLAQQAYMTQLEEDEEHFASQLMEETTREGTIYFDEFTIAAVALSHRDVEAA